MDRRSLLLGGLSAVASTVALRAEEVILPEIRQQPALTRDHLRGVWLTLYALRREHKWKLDNDTIRADLTAYLDRHGASFPATFVGKPEGNPTTYEVTLNGFFEKERKDGCKELYLSLSCPQVDRGLEPMFLNVECP